VSARQRRSAKQQRRNEGKDRSLCAETTTAKVFAEPAVSPGLAVRPSDAVIGASTVKLPVRAPRVGVCKECNAACGSQDLLLPE